MLKRTQITTVLLILLVLVILRMTSLTPIHAANPNLSNFPSPFVKNNVVNSTVIIGTSAPHGPCGAAHTIDTVGGMSITAKLGTYGSVTNARFYLDTDVAWYDGAGHKVYYWPVEGLTNIITVAGPGVNQITWRYFANPWFAPVYMYYSTTLHEWIVHTPTMEYEELDYVSSDPLMDLAVIEMVYVAEEGRYVMWVGGFGGYGTRAASFIVQLHGTSTPGIPSLTGTAMLVRWIDANSNSKIDTGDMWTVLEIVP